jgi:heme/copper-type cytochrome/quinol oxidase subunit 2
MHFPMFMKDSNGLTMGWFGALLVAGVIIFILVVSALVWKVSSYSCAVDQHRYGKPTHYTLLVGCFIEAERGQWVELGRYNAFRQVRR